ncbi:TetR/AcrR family transcriptional regulator [Dyadobacter sandarakinus]|uniref:TetR/AcrR family transcriptional regulator n=1 Tax=Dyadobacter sandarakinus TaxID=2747268 RepID=A0ABX7I2L7_9BACT|nr:TetR/AcrR family transcriptional regulator [Dyadobacter sandarakinus]QRR00120.1 TetR/AcrR family transcriptional regulator [Dyadobacter sandarakinus]
MKIGSKHLSKPDREQQIVDAADQLLREVGVYDFTIDQVVAYLDVAKGTFYKYYKSKDDILAQVSVQALTMLLDYFERAVASKTDLLQATKELIMSCYEYYIENPRYFELIIYMERPEFSSNVESYLMISQRLRDYFTDHIAKCQLEGVIRRDINPIYCTYMIWGSCMGLMNFIEAKRLFIEDIGKINRKDLLEVYTETLIAGMKA